MSTEEPKTTLSTCETHGCQIYSCSVCMKTVCKICCFESKSELEHLKTHYDSINGLNPDDSQYKSKLDPYEGYELLNKCFLEYIDKANTYTESTYEKIFISKEHIIRAMKFAMEDAYKEITQRFEKSVKEVNSQIDGLNLSDHQAKEEFKRVKKNLDDQTEFLDSEEKISQMFNGIIEKANKRFDRMKIPDLCKDNSLFSLGRFGVNLNFKGTDSNVVITEKKTSGTYWCIRSEEVLDGEFTARVKVKRIDAGKTGTYWNFGFGICRHNSTNDNNYYNDAITMLSNGWLANKFTSSGSHRQLFTKHWAKDDILIIKRDEKNTVWFGVNDENNLKKAFDGITGEFRIVLGFGIAMQNDEFELIEIDRS